MSSVTPEQPILTLHWLEASRSQRILWLLEELKIDYKLKLYHRDDARAAEAALFEVSPFGKSPVLEIDHKDGKPTRKVYESAVIIQHLIDNYDYHHKFFQLDPEQREEVEFYLHLTESSIQPLLTFVAIHAIGVEKSPFLARGVITHFTHSLDTAYTLKNIKIYLQYLEDQLSKNYLGNTSSSQDLFFVANKLSGADIILIFPLEVIFDGKRLENLGLDVTKFPLLAKWVSEIKSRVAFQKSIERIEKDGKGEFRISPIGKS